ncbi:MAG: ABC transporter permease [Propionicimonas sp.]
MKLTANLRMAAKSLRVNKMRALLTMLGIVIGIGSVIAILTVGNALSSSVSSSISVLGSNNIAVALQQRNQTGAGFPPGNPNAQRRPAPKDLITDQMIQAMRQRFPTQVSHVSLTEAMGGGKARDGRRFSNVTVLGTNGDYGDVNNLTIIAGRFLSESDVKGFRSAAVVSDHLVANMFGGDPRAALQQEVRVYLGSQIHTFSIVGVYEFEQSALTVSQVPEKEISTSLYVPVTTAKRLAGGPSGYQSIMVMAATDVDPIAFAGQLKDYFVTLYANNLDYTIAAVSMKSITEQVNSVMGSLSVGLSVIAGISLLVGGIGVMNIMLVSVTERTREIGLRKAVGATPNNIRVQFLVESIIVCLIGGVLGVLLGGALGYVGSYLLAIPTLPTLSSIAIAVGFSISIGVFFGFYPANRAAKLNPIDALRSL